MLVHENTDWNPYVSWNSTEKVPHAIDVFVGKRSQCDHCECYIETWIEAVPEGRGHEDGQILPAVGSLTRVTDALRTVILYPNVHSIVPVAYPCV